jgi:hypothetical protein
MQKEHFCQGNSSAKHNHICIAPAAIITCGKRENKQSTVKISINADRICPLLHNTTTTFFVTETNATNYSPMLNRLYSNLF